jgi:hypothetical protein
MTYQEGIQQGATIALAIGFLAGFVAVAAGIYMEKTKAAIIGGIAMPISAILLGVIGMCIAAAFIVPMFRPQKAGTVIYKCENCDWSTRFRKDVLPAKDLFQRVGPGEPLPEGECPECGALVHRTKGPDQL